MRIRPWLALLASVASVAGLLAASPVNAKELKFLTFKPQSTNDEEAITLQWFANQFNERMAGKNTIKIYWGGSVAKAKGMPDAVETGLGDIGDVVLPYFQDRFPLNAVGTYFEPQPHSRIELGQKMIQWYDEYPQFDAEMAKYNLKVIGWWPLESYGIMCTKPINSPKDLKGLRIRSYGRIIPLLIEQLGATPVSIIASEGYEALQRHIIDCTPTGVLVAHAWKYDEVAKYFIQVPFGANWGHIFAMNRKSFDALDAQSKSILVGLGKEFLVHDANVSDEMTNKVLAEWKKSGIKIMPFPAAPMAKAVQSKAVQKIRKEWIERADKAGLPGQKIADYFAFK